ncbi:hypothetical protein [Kitasatospora sp. NPDC094015]|uniref:hypothetical protein n=1 Tax=Kitasatospora sp. NPDC094015 TaxID=3155205 RepID=UPI003333EC59
MDILVVLELDHPANVRLLGPDRRPADPPDPVRQAHAAAADAAGACGSVTLCGRDTADMTVAPHRSTGPDQPWWPPHWHPCSICRAAPRPGATAAPAAPAAG